MVCENTAAILGLSIIPRLPPLELILTVSRTNHVLFLGSTTNSHEGNLNLFPQICLRPGGRLPKSTTGNTIYLYRSCPMQ